MLFNTFEYFLFLSIVFLLYWFFFKESIKGQNILILVASYSFYAWWDWRFLGLLVLITLLDFLYGFGVASSNKKKAKLFLYLSVINNLGILAVFKYYNFFATELQVLLDQFGVKTNILILKIALPVGVSFYTFHGMSYVFDIFRNQLKPVRNFVEYSVFVSFFPLLVAGPIERANHLLPQIQGIRKFNYYQAVEGCRLILWGLVKKVLIADVLAITVDEVFNDPMSFSSLSLILSIVAFSFQIYCDFSGYTDIALGTAKLLGFELLTNFKFPYFSRDIAEFWKRWHISLSSWFRDYLYIPMGGSRNGILITVRNVSIVFLLSGLWHGASWNFIVWGLIHACGFLVLLLFGNNKKNTGEVVAHNASLPSFPELVKMLTTFSFVSFSWIFFRAKDIGTSWLYIKRIFTDAIQHPNQFLSLPREKTVILLSFLLILLDWWFRRDNRHLRLPQNKFLRWSAYVIAIFFLLRAIARVDESNSFIYFQF